MNRGAQELRALHGSDLSQAQMALAIGEGATAKQVSQWMTGATVPIASKQERIHEVYGIEPPAWQEQILPPVGVVQPVPEGNASPYETALALSKQVQGELQLIASDPTLRPDQRLDRLQQCGDIMAKVGKLTGATVMNERQIMASPVWAAISEVIEITILKEPNGEAILGRLAAALDGMKARDA